MEAENKTLEQRERAKMLVEGSWQSESEEYSYTKNAKQDRSSPSLHARQSPVPSATEMASGKSLVRAKVFLLRSCALAHYSGHSNRILFCDPLLEAPTAVNGGGNALSMSTAWTAVLTHAGLGTRVSHTLTYLVIPLDSTARCQLIWAAANLY